MTTPDAGQTDFVIITALEKEAKAVVCRLEHCTLKRFEAQDIRTYHCGTVPIQGTSRAYRVAVVLLPATGEISAATAVTDALVRWNPRFVLMVGIAGGIPQDDLDPGDVVVGDQIVGYDYGKVTDQGLKPRDHVYPASALLLDRVRNFWDERWAQQVNVPRPGNARRGASRLFVGPIASGNRVVASTKFRRKLTARWPKLTAVEMEAEGVFAAVFDRPQIRSTLVIRGICDMADERKGDEWQEYAANAAAAFAIAFLQSGPVGPAQTTQVPKTSEVLVSLAKLPSTSPDLFGRAEKLAALDAAWENPQVNVLTLVAWGGVGKTALVNRWLSQLARDNYRGAERVFGWSFYSQGASEGRQVSADPFIAAALTWFGDPDPTAGSPWDKGERLAALVKRQRTLLILDGLEPLQNPPPVETGRIKDPGLCCFLRELARQNPGLVVVTTRLPVDDLKECAGSSLVEIDLEALSAEAGAAYLAHLGVQGTEGELQQAAAEYGGHALALTLLGRYLATVHGGDVRLRGEIPRLTDEKRQGAHARRVMKAYERWFAGKPELDVLWLLGLFDRPADSGATEALKAPPPIPSLTSNLQSLSHADWQYTLESLREARLLADPDPADPGVLDCHPLLREHFADRVRAEAPAAWRAAHARLYEHYKASAKEYPDTLAEMAPLFAAVAHGCQAGRHQEALDEVYWRRIQRGKQDFNWKKLGAFGADLVALSGFFDPPWRRPVDGLREETKSWLLGAAGFHLRALGRLAEAAQPMQASLDAYIAQENWEAAAITAGNLSELTLTRGDLAQALEYARQSVEVADRSGGAFQRMGKRTTLADALHQAGHPAEAEAAFREAEEMQKAREPELPLLYSLWGFRYCDLLLSQRQYEEVVRRAGQTLEWAKQYSGKGLGLLDIALDHLSLGRAHLLEATVGAHDVGARVEAQVGARRAAPPLQIAAEHLEHAVDGLRQAGQQQELPRGLVARAALRRVTGAFDQARRDVDEACAIATRGGMRLYEADCHLEHTRLCLAMGEKNKARQHLTQAQRIIAETGYHRRDGEALELEAALSSPPS